VIEPIQLEFTVACSPEHAFELWTARTSMWWPHGHSVSAVPGLAITFEPRAGGRIYERAPDGAEHDWGEILRWNPPTQLSYLWHLRQDRADASEVEITFRPHGAATTVLIVHRAWERLGARGREVRQRNERGWAGLVPHYVAACA
jgi:uncharacterized protein YndB with AHSA1/START domain